MQQYLDWSTFIKVDNAATLDLFVSLTAALHEEGQLYERDVESLRSILNTLPTQWSSEGRSVVNGLLAENASILQIVANRYGVSGFSLNHTRFTMRSLLSDLISKLVGWADLSLKKSELVFNRPFFVKRESRIERRELFSHVLVVMARLLHDTVGELRLILNELSTMRSSEMLDITGATLDADIRIAISLGFSGTDPMGAFSRAERHAVQRLSLCLTHLSESIVILLQDLITNCQNSDLLVATTGQCELLAAEAQKFAGLTLPESNSFTVWETRRLAVNFGIYSISQIVGAITQSSMASFSPQENRDSANFLSRDVERTLTAEMSTRGIDISTASEAADALIKYCLHYKIKPGEIIEPELKKIHASLTAETLNKLIAITSSDISATPGGQTSKARIIESSDSIRKSLARLSPFSVTMSVLLACCYLGMSGCGLKTGLKNDTPELRPEIPFRGEAPVLIFKNQSKTSVSPATTPAQRKSP